MMLSMILAADRNWGIGKDNQLLCHLPADLKYFKQVTSGHPIIMGRKTFESIGRPLPNRLNIVITQQENYQLEGVSVAHSLEAALELAAQHEKEETFIIGGAQIFNLAMPICHRIYLTEIDAVFDADTFFPKPGKNWKEMNRQEYPADEKNPYPYAFVLLGRSAEN